MKYRTIVADPPWDHSDGTGVKLSISAAGKIRKPLDGPALVTKVPYPVMSLAEIAALPVGLFAEKDAHLYVWVTNRYLRHVWDIAAGWGFNVVSIQTWCKEPRGFLGGGVFPSNTEFFAFCRRGQLPAKHRAAGRWFRWARLFGPAVAEGKCRHTQHSAKPEHFYDLVEQVSPGPYVELFARRHRMGWDVWGNESANTAQLEITA